MRHDLIKKLLTLTDEQLSQVYMRVFNSDDGQLVLEDLRQRCFNYISTIADTDRETFANEGKRTIVLMIETRLQPIETEKEREE